MDVLTAMNVPVGLHAYITELYRKCDLFFSLFGYDVYVCILRAGVIQGCPLSGTLFTVVIDIFLEFMYQTIHLKGRGEIAACADDIGGVLKSYHYLQFLFPIFEECENLANLVLKPQKCILVPTAKLASLQVKTCMYEWITSMIPKWRKFSVQSYAKYL
eukprot:10458843-Karenia_brevis.AAC.1